MKKIAASILTLAMLCTLLAACGGQQQLQDTSPTPNTSDDPGMADQTSSEELDAIAHKLLADWYAYTIRCEFLYGDMRWALSYLDPFFEDLSWDSLQTARAAMAIAKRRAEATNAKPLEAQMTSEAYDKLAQSGAYVSAVQLVVNSIQTAKDAAALDYHVYRDHLNSPSEAFFLTYELETFEDWVHLMQQIYDIELRTCAVQTDYLLSCLDSEDEEARFVEAITEKCPQINAWRKDNPQDQDELEKLSNELLNEQQTLTNELAAVVGRSQADLELFRDASEIDTDGGMDELRRYVAAIAADAVDLKGFPIALPYPDWWYEKDNETFTYLWNNTEDEEDDTQNFVMPGDVIDAPPDQCIVEWVDVSLEEYLTYLELVKRYKIPAQYTSEKEGRYTTYYEFRTASFVLVWEENEVSLFVLEGSVCFAPIWYIYHTRLVS